ncbi:MAG TPA: hypothetical protein VFT74_16105 [Isosphaeraceae bacterium]|nr:hypothetical protein [Isosphaeraceae bacterium]
MIRKVLFGLGLLVGSTGFLGCGGGSDTTTELPPAADQKQAEDLATEMPPPTAAGPEATP